MISDRTYKGYQIENYGIEHLINACKKAGLSILEVFDRGNVTQFGQDLIDYLNYRYDRLQWIETKLRTLEQAIGDYNRISRGHTPKYYKIQYTKKKIKQPLVLTNTINCLTEKALNGAFFEPDPNKLITVSKNDGTLLHTISRRVDGAYPSLSNATAIWETKEYYVGRSFGSRIADGIYETMLVGEELLELESRSSIKVHHYLIIDGRDEWWERGKSYLCRILDILHMGYIDQALVGSEVLEEWPRIVKSWRQH